VTHENNAQNRSDLLHTADLLRGARPRISELRLDEIKQEVVRRDAARPRTLVFPLLVRRRLLGFSLFASLFAMSSTSAAAQALNLLSGGTLGKTLGVGKTQGTSFFFGSLHMGGDSSDNASHVTYCGNDHGSDTDHGSDGKGSDGKDQKSGTYATVHTSTTTTHTNGGGSSENNPCTNGSDSSDGKSEHSGKDDKSGGKDDKYGKDSKSGGKDDNKSSTSSKSSGKSGGR
jgi:hypothetical protein